MGDLISQLAVLLSLQHPLPFLHQLSSYCISECKHYLLSQDSMMVAYRFFFFFFLGVRGSTNITRNGNSPVDDLIRYRIDNLDTLTTTPTTMPLF